eukprot:4309706-Prymnesium_polylepis.1
MRAQARAWPGSPRGLGAPRGGERDVRRETTCRRGEQRRQRLGRKAIVAQHILAAGHRPKGAVRCRGKLLVGEARTGLRRRRALQQPLVALALLISHARSRHAARRVWPAQHLGRVSKVDHEVDVRDGTAPTQQRSHDLLHAAQPLAVMVVEQLWHAHEVRDATDDLQARVPLLWLQRHRALEHALHDAARPPRCEGRCDGGLEHAPDVDVAHLGLRVHCRAEAVVQPSLRPQPSAVAAVQRGPTTLAAHGRTIARTTIHFPLADGAI